MKVAQSIYLFMAISMSAIVIGIACAPSLNVNSSLEVPFEEPIDGDMDDDNIDDKEFIAFLPALLISSTELIHSTFYLVSHPNRVKEISTPPPQV